MAAATDRRVEPPIRELNEVVTPDEERATKGSQRRVHAGESRPH
jgi:hypothetical protein